MTIQTTYEEATADLNSLCNQVVDDRAIVIIERTGEEPVALISAEELSGLLETAYLLRAPKNAERLLAALERSQSNVVRPSSLDELRRELGL